MQMVIRRSALAVAMASCALGAQAATLEGQLYGDLRYAYTHYDADGSPRRNVFDSTNSHAGVMITTRDGGYAATLVYERGLDADDDATVDDDTVRQSYLSVSSPYGTALYGRAPTAYKLAGQKLDPFYNTAIGTISGAAFGGSPAAVRGPSYGLSALTSDLSGNGFIANQLAYVSPEFMGVRVNAAFFMNENDRPDDDHDYGVGAEWNGDLLSGRLQAGAQYLDIRSNTNFQAIGIPGSGAVKATRVHAAYSRESWGVGASWEPLDLRDGENRDYYFASGWLRVAPKTRVAAAYGNTEATPFEGNGYSLGLFHEVLQGLEVYAAARHTDRDVAPDKSNDLAAGVTYRFRLSGQQTL
ncbi:porin [Sinimarinibacterium thermocellulolyticum]|uniref:Porin n=1 Tax=Sinimarinibacterium thermocellulolyticum TaxID=3170016 RepID=A0ABV2A950_9GAMM